MEPTTDEVRAYDSLELFLAIKEARGLQPVSIANYREVAERFLAREYVPVELSAIREDHLVRWLTDLRREGKAPSTIAYHQRHLYAWLHWAYERRDLDHDVARRVPRVRVPETRRRTLDASDFLRLVSAAAMSSENGLRDVALLHLLWSTGLRRNELAQLDLEDVDLRAGELVVHHGKGGRTRVVPFDAATKAALAEYVMTARGRAPGALLVSRGSQPMTSNAVRLAIQRLGQKAGVKVSSHDFRRGFAARMRKGGLDLGATMTLLGHASPVMTLRYSREGEEAAAVSAYRRIVG